MCNTMHMDNTIETTSNEEVKTDEIVQPIEPEIVVEEPKPVGRPSDYNHEIVDLICEKITEGLSIRTICNDENMPNASTIFKWLREHEEFSKQYVRATEERVEAQHEDLLEFGDQAIEHAEQANPKAANAVVSGYKLKADNLKWSMSKMKPKKYGEKLDMTTNGKDLPTPIYNGSATESRT